MDLSRWPITLPAALAALDVTDAEVDILGYEPPADHPWDPRSAAVLIPIIDAPEPSILFTARSRGLSTHSGQVSFPGGAVESDDDSLADAALRETFEEIGFPKDRIEPLGRLDFYDTISGFRVAPVVARVESGLTPVLQEAEVEAIFHVPLSVCLDRSAYEPHWIRHEGKDHELARLRYAGWTIWGATAGMLMNLIERLETATGTGSESGSG